MFFLYDLQEELETFEAGEFTGTDILVPLEGHTPTMRLEAVEDVKTILVTDRAASISGVGILISAIPGARAGDRITVTGRFGNESPTGSWGVALTLHGGEEASQLAHQIAPRGLYSLSHILGEQDFGFIFSLHTTQWGAINPIMDFYIDNISVSRKGETSVMDTDSRTTVYSLGEDAGIQEAQSFDNSGFLVRSGAPAINIFRRGDSYGLHVGARVMDFYGVDINLKLLQLLPGNPYQITVTGRLDGPAPEGTLIMLQGIPGYSWRGVQNAGTDQEFTITHALSQSEVAAWSSLRITTNSAGTDVSFYIYSIEIKRLGLT